MELLKLIRRRVLTKDRYTYKPIRGKLNNLPEKLIPNELFYITDARMLGVANAEGKPQLLTEVIHYEHSDLFPNYPENSHLFYSLTEEILFYYDHEEKKYNPVTIKFQT